MDRKEPLAALIGLVACCLLAPLKIDIGAVGVTLQTLILFTTAAYLGAKWGTAVVAAYLLLGALGLPVFAGYVGGVEKLLGPTSGFLWAFPFLAFYLGMVCHTEDRNFFFFILHFFRAHVLLLIPGFIVLYFQLEGVNIWGTLVNLLPGLLIKSVAGGLLALLLIRKVPLRESEEY